MRRRLRRPAARKTPELVDAIKKLASTHWQYEIAMELKISQSSVSKWALAHGIKTRTRKEAIRRHLNERC